MIRSDHGQVGGIEGVIFGVLVFVLGVLVIANAWGVVDAKLAASAAAREGTRAFVESRGHSTEDAALEAIAAADQALVGHGRSVARREPIEIEGTLTRCSRVTVRVRYRVPLVSIPLLGRYGTGFRATGRHSEIVDPFRAGLEDRSTCVSVLGG